MQKHNMRTEKKSSIKNSATRLVLIALLVLIQTGWMVFLMLKLNAYSTAITLALTFIAVFIALKIFGTHVNSAQRMPWLIVITAVPFFGICIYLLFGRSIVTKGMRRRFNGIESDILVNKLSQDETVIDEIAAKDKGIANQCRYISHTARYPVYKNTDVEYYAEADISFAAQIEELKKAEHFIFMEYHAIEDALSFERLKKVLIEKAQSGVEVRIFYDDLGSIFFLNKEFIKRMREQGIQCRVFNPLKVVVNMFMNNRDHRKIMVIDGLVGFTGGYNMANEYFNLTHPYGYWKDTGVQITGLAVRSLTATFLENWNAVKGNDIDDADFGKYLEQPYADPHAMAEEIGETGQSRAYVQPYADRPMDNEHVGEEVYISLINKATRYCWFVTPYLILTDEMVHAIRLAKKRGVDVRIITPAIPDKRIVYAVTRSYYHCLAKHGVRIYEYTPGFCHAKMCVVDDVVATCGTINLDYRSLYHHFENGCLYAYGPAVQETRQDMEAMMRESLEVTEKYNTGRSQGMRFIQMLLRLIAPLL